MDAGLFALFVIGLFLLVVILWLYQFIDLMLMSDEEFPGRSDKALWVVVFLALFVMVAPIAFGLWKDRNRRRLRALRPADAARPSDQIRP
jgi:hypothetical protein